MMGISTLYLHVVTVHETVHNLLEEEARLRLSKPLPLPHIIQQGTPLCQLHHLRKKKTDNFSLANDRPTEVRHKIKDLCKLQ